MAHVIQREADGSTENSICPAISLIYYLNKLYLGEVSTYDLKSKRVLSSLIL